LARRDETPEGDEQLSCQRYDHCLARICTEADVSNCSNPRPYSITSSATASSVVGIVRPSALAVCTGRLAGLRCDDRHEKCAIPAPFRWRGMRICCLQNNVERA
jgi:hypothetical protein